jgi:hypothetical protein
MSIKRLRPKIPKEGPNPMEQERRRSPRFPFIAAAEVHEENNGTQISARISDISATGCYMDTINPLPGGTAVRMKIFNETQSIEASATVAYSVTHLGRGLSFGEVPASSRDILREWMPAAV